MDESIGVVVSGTSLPRRTLPPLPPEATSAAAIADAAAREEGMFVELAPRRSLPPLPPGAATTAREEGAFVELAPRRNPPGQSSPNMRAASRTASNTRPSSPSVITTQPSLTVTAASTPSSPSGSPRHSPRISPRLSPRVTPVHSTSDLRRGADNNNSSSNNDINNSNNNNNNNNNNAHAQRTTPSALLPRTSPLSGRRGSGPHLAVESAVNGNDVDIFGSNGGNGVHVVGVADLGSSSTDDTADTDSGVIFDVSQSHHSGRRGSLTRDSRLLGENSSDSLLSNPVNRILRRSFSDGEAAVARIEAKKAPRRSSEEGIVAPHFLRQNNNHNNNNNNNNNNFTASRIRAEEFNRYDEPKRDAFAALEGIVTAQPRPVEQQSSMQRQLKKQYKRRIHERFCPNTEEKSCECFAVGCCLGSLCCPIAYCWCLFDSKCWLNDYISRVCDPGPGD